MLKKHSLASALFFAVLLCVPLGAEAATSPLKMSFQGKLLDTSNNPRNGTFDFTFRIYDSLSGGAQLWTENQSAVVVSNGVFSVELGSVTALSSALFAGTSAFLEVQVSPDSPMTPRQQLLMAAYSLRALIADSLTAGDTNYVQVRTSLQSGAEFHVASATVAGRFQGLGNSSFTATGSETFSLFTSSGLRINAGTLRLESASSLDAVGTVAAGTVTARTSLLLPQGSALIGEGSARWDASADLLSVGSGVGSKTMADTSSAQTLTNKTLSSSDGNTVDATHLQTRSIDSAAPSTGMTLEWDNAASKWGPVYGATMTVVMVPFPPTATLAAADTLIDNVYLTPFNLAGTIGVNQIRYRVGTSVANSSGDVGIYNVSGQLVASGGTNSASFTTAEAKVVAMQNAPRLLQPGQYYFAMSAKTAAPRPRGINLAVAGMVKGLGYISCGATDCGATLPASVNLGGITDGFTVMFMSANE